jgi:hypothetical protein
MFIFSDKMKAMPPIKRITRIVLSLAVVILSVANTIYGQTSTWDGSNWQPSGVAPSVSTGSYTFIVNGNGCTIGNASMSSLTVNPGFSCTISSSGTVTSNTVNIPFDINISDTNLIVNGSLNVVNLSIFGWLGGTGTVNLSGGSFSLYDGTNYGYMDVYNFNVLSGSIEVPTQIVIKNMTVAQNASVNLTYTGTLPVPSIDTLTLNGSFVNNYNYSISGRTTTYYYMTMKYLLINSTGSFNSANGYSSIEQSFKIGGYIAPATSVNSYLYHFGSSSTNLLEIFGNANVKFSDLTTSSATYINLGTLKVYGGGKFTVNKNLTVNTLTINDGGNVITSGTPTLSVKTSIDPIAGRLILFGATLNYTPTTLTLNGTNAALAYLNKANYYVTLSGGTDTIRNCTFQKLVVNGANGIVSNNSAYRIQRIDAAGPVTIASLLKNDTIQISATGSAVLTGNTRVAHMVDIAAGASLTSNGNLTMLDGSNLYFAADGQIIGNIKWHRKYGSTGWVYMGVPFPNLTRALVGSGGISQQTIYMNEYDESKVSPRWSAVGTTEALVVGKGYNLAMGTITNDTLIFTGNPRLQTVSLPVTYSYSNGSQFDSQRGYNLVSNPFTAPISVSGFFTDNPHLNKIYYWDNQGGGKGVYVTRTSGGIFTPQLSSVTVKNQTKISATYLAPNQGFFIKLDSANYATTGSVVFNPSSVTKNLNDNFLKDAPVLLRLNAKNTSGTQNDIVFQFNNAATSEINPDLDFSKLVSDTYPLEIYSFKKGSKFSIQTVKVDTATRIPIGLVIKNNEKHSIWVDNFDALPAGVDIFIHDKLTDRSVNLKDSAFTGGLSAGTYDNRFEVVFKDMNTTSSTSGLENKSTSSDVAIRSLNGQVYADFKTEQKNVDIQVCDISGRVIYEKKVNWAQGSILLDTDFSSTRVYLITITGNQLFRVIKFLML